MISIKKSAICLVLLVAIWGCQEQQVNTESNGPKNTQADAQQLRHLKEVEWPKAYKEQDTLLLDRILGDDFKMIDAQGNWSDKAFELQWIKEHGTQYDSFFYEIKRLDVLPNGTAIVAGSGHIFNDSTYTEYQSSNVLIKREGQWKAILSHVSGVETSHQN